MSEYPQCWSGCFPLLKTVCVIVWQLIIWNELTDMSQIQFEMHIFSVHDDTQSLWANVRMCTLKNDSVPARCGRKISKHAPFINRCAIYQQMCCCILFLKLLFSVLWCIWPTLILWPNFEEELHSNEQDLCNGLYLDNWYQNGRIIIGHQNTIQRKKGLKRLRAVSPVGSCCLLSPNKVL